VLDRTAPNRWYPGDRGRLLVDDTDPTSPFDGDTLGRARLDLRVGVQGGIGRSTGKAGEADLQTGAGRSAQHRPGEHRSSCGEGSNSLQGPRSSATRAHRHGIFREARPYRDALTRPGRHRPHRPIRHVSCRNDAHLQSSVGPLEPCLQPVAFINPNDQAGLVVQLGHRSSEADLYGFADSETAQERVAAVVNETVGGSPPEIARFCRGDDESIAVTTNRNRRIQPGSVIPTDVQHGRILPDHPPRIRGHANYSTCWLDARLAARQSDTPMRSSSQLTTSDGDPPGPARRGRPDGTGPPGGSGHRVARVTGPRGSRPSCDPPPSGSPPRAPRQPTAPPSWLGRCPSNRR